MRSEMPTRSASRRVTPVSILLRISSKVRERAAPSRALVSSNSRSAFSTRETRDDSKEESATAAGRDRRDGLADRRFRGGVLVAQFEGHVEKSVVHAADDNRNFRPVGKGRRRAAESGHGFHGALLPAFGAPPGASKT